MMLPVGAELIVLLAVVVMLFGTQKIPELARSTGEAVSEFRNAAPGE